MPKILVFLSIASCHLYVFLVTVGLVDITELRGYLQKLWGFLKRHSVQLREERHLCCWISLLFGEQDDDMMEAAKALLSIFLHYRYVSISSTLQKITTLT